MSLAHGYLGYPLVAAAQSREHRRWRITGWVTPSNVVAVMLLLVVTLVGLSTMVPYRIINTSEACYHCGGYRYSSTRLYGGVPVGHNRIFAHTQASRLYQQLVAAKHEHEWILSGQCSGTGNIFDQADVKITKGNGSARSEQVEQSLLALQEVARLVE